MSTIKVPQRTFSPVFEDDRWRARYSITVMHQSTADIMRFPSMGDAERYQDILRLRGYTLYDSREVIEPIGRTRYILVYIKPIGNVIVDTYSSEEVERYPVTSYYKRKAKKYLAKLNTEE